MTCSHTIAKNFWDFYLVKWGLKKKATLTLNCQPDCLLLEFTRQGYASAKSMFKLLFKLIAARRFQYRGSTASMTILSEDRTNARQFDFDLDSLEAIEKAVRVCRTVEAYDQEFFKVTLPSDISFFIRKHVSSDIHVIEENFQQQQYSFLYPYLRGAVVMDIGANIGDTAILFCTQHAERVLAYEPHPFFAELLWRNVQLNKLERRITLFREGVSDQAATITLKDDASAGPTGTFGFKESHSAAATAIKVVPLSRVLASTPRVDVLKLDCEGAEFPAILSCPADLLRKVNVMGIEYHKEPASLIQYLQDAGFRVIVQKQHVYADRFLGLLCAVRQ